MRNTLFAFALAISVLPPGFASAGEGADRTEAIRLCRAEVAAQTGLDLAEVRFDEARVGARIVRVDLDVWRDGRLNNIRCDVTRGEARAIAAIEPTLHAAAATDLTAAR